MLPLAISVLGHLVVLDVLPLRSADPPRAAPVVLALRARIESAPTPGPAPVRKRPGPAADPPPSTATSRSTEHAVVARAHVTPPAREPASAASAREPERPMTPEAAHAAPMAPASSAPREVVFVAAEGLLDPPLPQSALLSGGPNRELQSRRLDAEIWVGPDGNVTKATVSGAEVSDATATLLEQALAALRFTPGRVQGEPVGAIVHTRLCFDSDGLPADGGEGCLRISEHQER